MKRTYGLLFAVALSLTAPAAYAQDSIAGKWTGELPAAQGRGVAQPITVELKLDGITLSGTVIEGALGSRPIANAAVDGNTFSFRTTQNFGGQDIVVSWFGEVTGDSLALTRAIGAAGEAAGGGGRGGGGGAGRGGRGGAPAPAPATPQAGTDGGARGGRGGAAAPAAGAQAGADGAARGGRGGAAAPAAGAQAGADGAARGGRGGAAAPAAGAQAGADGAARGGRGGAAAGGRGQIGGRGGAAAPAGVTRVTGGITLSLKRSA